MSLWSLVPVIGTYNTAKETIAYFKYGASTSDKAWKLGELGLSLVSDVALVATAGASAGVVTALSGAGKIGKGIKVTDAVIKTAKVAYGGKIVARYVLPEVSNSVAAGVTEITDSAAEATVRMVRQLHNSGSGSNSNNNNSNSSNRSRNNSNSDKNQQERSSRSQTKSNSTSGTCDRSRSRSDSKDRSSKKRGDHVINNGVNRVFRDIIKYFIKRLAKRMNMSITVEHLQINERDHPGLYHALYGDGPILVENEMVVHLPLNIQDDNARNFGDAMRDIQQIAGEFLDTIFNDLQNADGNFEDLSGKMLNDLLDRAREAISIMIQRDMTHPNGLFVDEPARKLWLETGSHNKKSDRENQFRHRHGAVEAMFNELAGKDADSSLLVKWAIELDKVLRRFIQDIIDKTNNKK